MKYLPTTLAVSSQRVVSASLKAILLLAISSTDPQYFLNAGSRDNKLTVRSQRNYANKLATALFGTSSKEEFPSLRKQANGLLKFD